MIGRSLPYSSPINRLSSATLSKVTDRPELTIEGLFIWVFFLLWFLITLWSFTVVAFNEIGEANVAAQEITGYSGEDVPLEAPSNFSYTQIVDKRSAILTWNPVNEDSVRGIHCSESYPTASKNKLKCLRLECFRFHVETENMFLFYKVTLRVTRLKRGLKKKANFMPARWLAMLPKRWSTNSSRTRSTLSEFVLLIQLIKDLPVKFCPSPPLKEVSDFEPSNECR